MRGLEEILASIHTELAEKMLERVRGGVDDQGEEIKLSAAEMNVIRQFLKDNGIDSVPQKNDPLGKLASELPDFSDNPHSMSH